MEHARSFIKVASIAAVITGLTTIGIHSNLFNLGELSFEDRLQLHSNSFYLLGKWWIIFHCLFVLISMWGFALLRFKKSPGWIGIGFVGFTVFSFTEIFRQLLALFYLNGLRKSYLDETSDSVKEILSNQMDTFSLFAYGMFALFIFAFALGNLGYGISLLREKDWGKWLGIALVLWAIEGFINLGNQFWGISWINSTVYWIGLIFQPSIRVVIGIWMWTKIKGIDT